jgi:hypothetical protein
MNHDDVMRLIKTRLSVRIDSKWGQYKKEIKVSLLLDNEEISSDSIPVDEVREDFG